MKIEQLRIFVETARAQSINQAAEKLYTSHQNLSATIKKMEDELNVRLFLRTSKGIVLSKEGEIFLKSATEMISIYDNALEKFRKKNDIIHFYTTTSLAELCNDIQGACVQGKYLSFHKNTVDEIRDMLEQNRRGVYFLTLDEKELQKIAADKKYMILAADETTLVICHKNNPLREYDMQQIGEKLINTVSRRELADNSMNVDDLNICKRMMREHQFFYTTTPSLYRANFRENEWRCLQESSLGMRYCFTVIFGLLDNELQAEIEKLVVETIGKQFEIKE